MTIHGKCNYRDLQTGVKCGCLRSRVLSINDYLCKACKLDLCYHEIIQPKESSKNFNDKLKNNRKNENFPYKKLITFKFIYIVDGKPNQKIPRG
jgi:hypothetical protein